MTASCCCGSVTLTLTGEPTLNAMCHCDDCKRRTGAAFGWNAYFKASDVELPKTDTEIYTPAIDPEQVRHRCPQCGSTLWWTSPFRPGEIGLAGGAIIDPPLPQPLDSARDDKRCAWLARPKGTTPWP